MSQSGARIFSSISSSANSAAFRLDPRGLPLVSVLFGEEPPEGGVGDYESRSDASGNGRIG